MILYSTSMGWTQRVLHLRHARVGMEIIKHCQEVCQRDAGVKLHSFINIDDSSTKGSTKRSQLCSEDKLQRQTWPTTSDVPPRGTSHNRGSLVSCRLGWPTFRNLSDP